MRALDGQRANPGRPSTIARPTFKISPATIEWWRASTGGGVLTGSLPELATGVGDDDGEVNEGQRTTASMDGTSSSSGVAQNFGTASLDSDEIPTTTKATVRAPTTKIEQGLGFGMMKERGWGRRQSLGGFLPSSRSSMAMRP